MSKTTTTTTKAPTKEDLKNENKALTKKVKALEKTASGDEDRIRELEDKMATLLSKMEEKETVPPTSNKTDFNVEDDITVISMVPCKLVLTTEGYGRGNPYIFESLGEEQDIPWGDLRDIVRNNKEMVKNGRFFILNEQAVTKLRIKNHLQKVLNPDQILNIMNQSPDKIVELYKMAPEKQQKIIVDMVLNKRIHKEKVDANLLQELGELCGRDLINMVLVSPEDK